MLRFYIKTLIFLISSTNIENYVKSNCTLHSHKFKIKVKIIFQIVVYCFQQNNNNFNTMHRGQQYMQTNYGNPYTDTYLSSMSQGPERDQLDRNVFKAIKQNNAQLIVKKQREPQTSEILLYNQVKELSEILISIRKKYDEVKIVTATKQKAISKLEEQKHLLEVSKVKIDNQSKLIKQSYKQIEEKDRQTNQLVENCEYQNAVRQYMTHALKNDILHYKKQCFDSNVKLVRTKTQLRELIQRNTNKKHIKSKCQLVLHSLKQTVQYRVQQRSTHIEQFEDLLKKKNENSLHKQQREMQLVSSMQTAMTERLPDEKFFLNKLLGQTFLRKILRFKMKKLMNEHKDVESAYNNIKKHTRITSVQNLIQDFLNKQERYGQLLSSISKAEVKIQKEKQSMKDLSNEHQKLQQKVAQIQQQIQTRIPVKEQRLIRQLSLLSEKALDCTKLQLALKRWCLKTYIKFKNLQDNRAQNHNYAEYAKELQGLDSIKLLKKTIKLLDQVLNGKEIQPESPVKSQLTTQRTEEKLSLRELTTGSVLSKDYSRRNFRVKTVAATEQAPQQDNHYDEGSQYDFLKINRRLVKKNNKTVTRARIKTKPF